jgi:alkylation response protein AidB-like acyl-CoA dehydrogenase
VTTPSRRLAECFGRRLDPEPDAVLEERARVRVFLADAVAAGSMVPVNDGWLSAHDPAFSRALGAQGWIGMTWPERYGGRDAPTLTRYAVVEELLVGGAPLAAHWFADRQVGPGLLKHGTEEQRIRLLPPMARGELYVCIGMSEPGSGSDLGSVRTRARRTDGGWVVNGSKTWTSHAGDAHLMLALVRTGAADESPATALTQLLIDVESPGVTVRPIEMADGRHDFCEVFLDDVHVPDRDVVGTVGRGWGQVLDELAFERSGPERFLSTFPMVSDVLAAGGRDGVGELVARYLVLRAMSARVNAALAGDRPPSVEAAVVKELGTRFEGETIYWARRVLPAVGHDGLRRQVDDVLLHSPAFTLRGGTTEIMRGVIARELGSLLGAGRG